MHETLISIFSNNLSLSLSLSLSLPPRALSLPPLAVCPTASSLSERPFSARTTYLYLSQRSPPSIA